MSPSFLDQLAQARPDPGGGAAAAYSAGVALALLTKVIRLERSRPRNNETLTDFWAEQLLAVRRLKRLFQRLRQADVEAYLNLARGLAAEPRQANFPLAVEEAAHCPWQIMEQSLMALELVSKAGKLCRPHLLADLLVAAEILGGALQGAHHIAAANLPLMPTDAQRQKWASRLAQTSHLGLEATLRVRSQLLARTHEALNSQ